MANSIFFATGNISKFEETKDILGIDLKRAEVEIEEIQAIEVSRVVKKKALDAYNMVGSSIIVEDTGLYIHSLNGLPGALTKWFMKSIGNDGIVKIVTASSNDRSAFAKTVFGYFDGESYFEFDGLVEGEISKNVKGNEGFGWDPIFVPKGCGKTFAQMGSREKNLISMRRKALDKLREFLRTTN